MPSAASASSFSRRENWIDDVPVYTGLAAVDVFLGATQLRYNDPGNMTYPGDFAFGGGHVIENLVAGKTMQLFALSYGTDDYPRREIRNYALCRMLKAQCKLLTGDIRSSAKTDAKAAQVLEDTGITHTALRDALSRNAEGTPYALPVEAPEGMAGTTFTEADIEAARKDTEKKTREAVEAEFAEKQRNAAREARKEEISTWCGSMVEAGKLTPALVKYGLPEILSFLADDDATIEFGEAKDKASYFERLKGLFESELPKLVDFSEVARRGELGPGDGSAGDKLDALTKKKMAEDKELDYSAAFTEVQKEHPDLVQEYQNEMQQAA